MTLTVKVTSNSPSQDYTHPDDHNLPTYTCTIVILPRQQHIKLTAIFETKSSIVLVIVRLGNMVRTRDENTKSLRSDT